MVMNPKLFEAISEREAISKMMGGEPVFSSTGRTYYMKDGFLCFFLNGDSDGLRSSIMFNDVIHETWYVKKPFDIREEMLARPNEWVGAFKSSLGNWFFVGFDHSEMAAVSSKASDKISIIDYALTGVYLMDKDDLDRCIPIEDVPEEELT